MTRSPTTINARYVAIGSVDRHRAVRRPSGSVRSSIRTPLATATWSAGTVSSKLNCALSVGWSLAGNQVAAPAGPDELGRSACGERVVESVDIAGVAVSIRKKNKK